jgi:hypothetical protein
MYFCAHSYFYVHFLFCSNLTFVVVLFFAQAAFPVLPIEPSANLISTSANASKDSVASSKEQESSNNTSQNNDSGGNVRNEDEGEADQPKVRAIASCVVREREREYVS